MNFSATTIGLHQTATASTPTTTQVVIASVMSFLSIVVLALCIFFAIHRRLKRKKFESDRLLIAENVQRYFSNNQDGDDEFFEEDEDSLQLHWEATPNSVCSRFFAATKFSQNGEISAKNQRRRASDYYVLTADEDEKVGGEKLGDEV